MPKLVENLKVLESQSNVIKDKVEAVVSSVVIAYVFTKYEVTLAPEKYEMLLKCLRLPPDEEVCHEFVRIIDEFDKDMLRYVFFSNASCLLLFPIANEQDGLFIVAPCGVLNYILAQ